MITQSVEMSTGVIERKLHTSRLRVILLPHHLSHIMLESLILAFECSYQQESNQELLPWDAIIPTWNAHMQATVAVQ